MMIQLKHSTPSIKNKVDNLNKKQSRPRPLYIVSSNRCTYLLTCISKNEAPYPQTGAHNVVYLPKKEVTWHMCQSNLCAPI